MGGGGTRPLVPLVLGADLMEGGGHKNSTSLPHAWLGHHCQHPSCSSCPICHCCPWWRIAHLHLCHILYPASGDSPQVLEACRLWVLSLFLIWIVIHQYIGAPEQTKTPELKVEPSPKSLLCITEQYDRWKSNTCKVTIGHTLGFSCQKEEMFFCKPCNL